MTLSPAFLDELRTRTLLSSLVGRSVKLIRAGREWKACCPFHDEKSASFTINDAKGFYHCFGCSAHGDAIRWLTDKQGLSFMDAVKELASAAGMEVPAPDPRGAERAERASGLHDVMAAAQAWFVEQLAGAGGASARDYLARRGVSDGIAAAFGLGFAPDSRGRLKSALSRFSEAMLVEAGLLIAVEGKDSYDRFRGRLMIPIRDPRGRCIAFGGRILGAGEPKYLNSPDTPLFDKGRTVWNLDRAAPAARNSDRLIVVEGYMDAVALADAGISEVVAPMGTALTEQQLERVWQLVDVPILCFDGDRAGQKAAHRAALRALPLLAPGKSLSFVTLGAGQDPDDLVRAGGRTAAEGALGGASPLVDYLWQAELAAAPVATPEAKAGLKRRLDTHIATITDADVRRHYAREMRQRFDATFFSERERRPFTPGARPPDRATPPSRHAKAISGAGIDPVYERPIMAGLVRHPAIVLTCGEALAVLNFADPELARLRDVLVEAAYDGDLVVTERIDTICANAGLSGLLGQLRMFNGLAFSFTRGDALPEVARRDLGMAIEALAARPELDAALAAATARLQAGGDEECFAEQARLRAAQGEANKTLLSLMGYDDDGN